MNASHARRMGAAVIAAASFAFLVASLPAAAGQAPRHVLNFTFWRQSGIALEVPAAWAAANVTFVETGRASDARAFHAAGGRYAVTYAAPDYYYVSPNYRSHGDFDESAFGHDATGARISRPQGQGIEYYLLPTSPAARDVYARVTARDAGNDYDFVFTDGVSDSLHTSLYRMNAPPVEILTDADYVNGMKSLLAVSARPAIINGYDNGNPLALLTYLGTPNVAAIYGEACLFTDAGPKTGERWAREADALLATTARQRYAFCGGHGKSSEQAGRLYWLASWWLTYDPMYSVSVEVFESPGDVYVFPESRLVPLAPVESAGTDISTLRTAGGAYVREFRRCYDGGSSIGACAAIVNPSGAPVTMPQLSLSYSHVLTLDARNLYDGGRIGFSGQIPTMLAPGQAAILFQ